MPSISVTLVGALLSVAFVYGLGALLVSQNRVAARARSAESDDIVAAVREVSPPGASVVRITHRLRFRDAAGRTEAALQLELAAIDAAPVDETGAVGFALTAQESSLIEDAPARIARLRLLAWRLGGAYDGWQIT